MNECQNYDGTNPLHQHDDGTWWFYDPFYDEYGPYENEQKGKEELERYCREVLG